MSPSNLKSLTDAGPGASTIDELVFATDLNADEVRDDQRPEVTILTPAGAGVSIDHKPTPDLRVRLVMREALDCSCGGSYVAFVRMVGRISGKNIAQNVDLLGRADAFCNCVSALVCADTDVGIMAPVIGKPYLFAAVCVIGFPEGDILGVVVVDPSCAWTLPASICCRIASSRAEPSAIMVSVRASISSRRRRFLSRNRPMILFSASPVAGLPALLWVPGRAFRD